MERKKTGITMIELLIVLGIIAILVGLLVPSLSAVKKMAKETKQKAQFATIELALAAFKNDYGNYPPSNWTPDVFTGDYCGAQKLAEALLGWDLLGFHPKSDFTSNGTNGAGIFVYDSSDAILFGQRKGPYLENATTNVFTLGSIFWKTGTGSLEANTHVLCDVFNAVQVTLPGGTTSKAGTPILYYRANSSSEINGIYNVNDNDAIVGLKEAADGRGHPFGAGPVPPAYSNRDEFFYGTLNPTDGINGYIQDPKITSKVWPYRPDSYILISAGADGIYGTGDDIRNFGN